MAPNRKKKKAVNNPGRGFATTSTPSKAKPQEQTAASEENAEPTASDQILRGQSHASEAEQPERELHELSPEELEAQLEESDLQLLAEKHGEKSRKDASHQASRLITEKRLLRSQAETLILHPWLPVDLMNLILSYVESQHRDGKSSAPASQAKVMAKDVPEDDIVIRVWTVEQTLTQMGFSLDQARDASRNLVKREFSGSPAAAVGKESIWGLTDCLNWLAMTCDASQLPGYEVISNANRPRTVIAKATTQDVVETPSSTPPGSRPTSPSPTEKKAFSEPSNVMHDNGRKQYSDDSDTETDDDPETLTAKYLTLKRQLYDLQPELAQIPRRGHPQSSKRMNIDAQGDNLNPRIVRLQRRLMEIETDILFDRETAQMQWKEASIALAKEASERKRLQLSDDTSSASRTPTNDRTTTPNQDLSDLTADPDDTASLGMLSDLFSSIDVTPSGTGPQQPNLEEKSISIREFGNPNGLKPRRVLEEACKARDSGCQAVFKIISRTSFNKRHSVVLKWSRDQPLPLPSPTAMVTSKADDRHLKVEMASIATPDASQSEGYVSTVALFILFSAVSKEEKVHFRLPGVWRDLWAEFSAAVKAESDAADRNLLRELRSMVSDQREKLAGAEGNIGPNRETCSKQNDATTVDQGIISGDPSRDRPELRALWASKISTPLFQRMLKFREGLPIWKFKNILLEAMRTNQAIIICGETGCGKSTQVPSFILEHELSSGRSCKIYCTEPRRISATSLARRVCEELGERKGDLGTPKSLVGYAIRLESKISPQTRLIYATTGIVMRMLEGSGDLGNITHLILDEVHERTIDSDFLLIILRKLMARRPALRVILMSATVNAKRFSDYLEGAPILNVPGRTYPVETRYLEDAIELTAYYDPKNVAAVDQFELGDDEDVKQDADSRSTRLKTLDGYSLRTRNTLASFDEYQIPYDLIVRLLETIATSRTYKSYSKAVLIFLPGIAEIRLLQTVVLGNPAFGEGWNVHALHSSIANEEQEQAFLVPPEGTRKIVLATNIAETGITIPDVTCVIDTGKHKEMRFDERRQLSRLIESFISRANAKQRRGRAGRVQNGLCFHLFSKARHDSLMSEEQAPEMLRLSLQDLVLRVKICNLGDIEHTLSEALDPPSSKNVRRAIDSLIDVKALTPSEDLTPLGKQLAKLPVDVFLGKLILLGSIFRCLDGALTIAAILTSKSPFSAPFGSRSQADLARLSFKRSDSDLLLVYNAYRAWRHVCVSNSMPEQQFCYKNYLSQQTLSNIEDLKAQLTGSLAEAGLIHLTAEARASLNRVHRRFVKLPNHYELNAENDLVLHSIIGWSFYPKLLKSEGRGWRNVANNQSISLAPNSVNKGSGSSPRWLSFYHIMQSSNKFYNAHETSSIEDFAIALVCGEAEFKMYSGVIVIDGHRIRFCVDDWKSMLALKYLRLHIRQIMAQAFRSPGLELTTQQQAWFDQSKLAMDQERLRGLVRRPTSSPHQALAQKHLKDHLEKYDQSHEIERSAEKFIARGLTIQNIMNLRSGPFTLSPLPTQRLDVQNIRHLDIAVVPFWKEEAQEDPADMADDSSDTPTITDHRRPHFSEEQRNAFKILHDWLASFPATTVQHFRFEWIGEVAGFNPLIFDKFAENWNTPDDNWFSNGVVAWSGLTTLRLKGVDIKDADVTTLTRRNPGLLSLIVETYWTEAEIAAGWASENPDDREVDVLRTKW